MERYKDYEQDRKNLSDWLQRRKDIVTALYVANEQIQYYTNKMILGSVAITRSGESDGVDTAREQNIRR